MAEEEGGGLKFIFDKVPRGKRKTARRNRKKRKSIRKRKKHSIKRKHTKRRRRTNRRFIGGGAKILKTMLGLSDDPDELVRKTYGSGWPAPIYPGPSQEPHLELVDELHEINQNEAEQMGNVGEGKCLFAQEYIVKRPLQIYRAANSKSWPSSAPGSLGNWWSFEQPGGTLSDYRKDYVICPEWSPLDIIWKATLGVGQRILLCGGQSVFCNDKLVFNTSKRQQVYVLEPNKLVNVTHIGGNDGTKFTYTTTDPRIALRQALSASRTKPKRP
jgi:hypothetical protein